MFRTHQIMSLFISCSLVGFAFAGIWPAFISAYPMRVIGLTCFFLLMGIILFIFDFLIPLCIVFLDKFQYYKVRRQYGYMLPIYIRNVCFYILGICAIIPAVTNIGVALHDYPRLQQLVGKTTEQLRVDARHDDIDQDKRTERFRVYDITYMHRLGLRVPDEYMSNAGYMNTRGQGHYHYSQRYSAKTAHLLRKMFDFKYTPVMSWNNFIITNRDMLKSGSLSPSPDKK